MSEDTTVDGARSLELVRAMYEMARELARSEEPYYASHGRKMGARLHHMILSQDPGADVGFFDDSYR
jgi:hypothetical protein